MFSSAMGLPRFPVKQAGCYSESTCFKETLYEILWLSLWVLWRGKKKNPKTTWNSFCLKILDGKPHFMEGQSPYKVTATLRTKITQPHMPLLLSSCYDTLMVVVSRPYEICCRREFSSVLRSLQCVHLSLQG